MPRPRTALLAVALGAAALVPLVAPAAMAAPAARPGAAAATVTTAFRCDETNPRPRYNYAVTGRIDAKGVPTSVQVYYRYTKAYPWTPTVASAAPTLAGGTNWFPTLPKQWVLANTTVAGYPATLNLDLPAKVDPSAPWSAAYDWRTTAVGWAYWYLTCTPS